VACICAILILLLSHQFGCSSFMLLWFVVLLRTIFKKILDCNFLNSGFQSSGNTNSSLPDFAYQHIIVCNMLIDSLNALFAVNLRNSYSGTL